jgi:predicted GNAT family N-acyltransferase
MKYTNLKDSPTHFEALITLIELGFEYEEQYSYKEDFYLLIEKSNWENLHLLISEAGEIVVHVGARLLTLSNSSPALFLGGIVVNPSFKKEGYFKELFSTVINIYKERVALMVLWSDLDGLYKKFNFHEAGKVIQTGSSEITDKDLELIGFKKSSLSKHIGSQELDSCYNSPFGQEILSIKRDKSHWEKVLQIKSTKFYTYTKNNKLASYLFLGKGMDLPSVIHEIGFIDLETQDKLLPALYSSKVWLPFIEGVLPNTKDTSFYSGIFRISNDLLFKKFVVDVSKGYIEVIKISDQEIIFLQNKIKASLGHQEFLNLILLPSDLNTPTPLWITGIESI